MRARAARRGAVRTATLPQMHEAYDGTHEASFVMELSELLDDHEGNYGRSEWADQRFSDAQVLKEALLYELSSVHAKMEH